MKERMKGFISGFIIATMIFALSVTAFAATGNKTITAAYDNIKVFINGTEKTMMSDGQVVEPFTYQGRTYVPLKAITEAMGAYVSWDSSSKSINISTATPSNQNISQPFTPSKSSDTSEVNASSMEFPWHLVSNDGKVYLGKCTTNKFDTDGIWNAYGTYGNKYSTDSIWNSYGTYGGKYSSESAFNKYATSPPMIIDDNGYFIGYLTIDTNMTDGVSIEALRAFLLKYNQ